MISLRLPAHPERLRGLGLGLKLGLELRLKVWLQFGVVNRRRARGVFDRAKPGGGEAVALAILCQPLPDGCKLGVAHAAAANAPSLAVLARGTHMHDARPWERLLDLPGVGGIIVDEEKTRSRHAQRLRHQRGHRARLHLGTKGKIE